jgi:hypothetical protein
MEFNQAKGKLYNLKSFVESMIKAVDMGAMDPDAAIMATKKVAAELDQQKGGREPGQEG